MADDEQRLRDLEVVVAMLARRGVVVDAKVAEVEALRRVGDLALKQKKDA